MLLEYVHLLLRSVYSIGALYLALHSLVSAIFSLLYNFAPIPIYRGNKATRPSYVGSATVLSDINRAQVFKFTETKLHAVYVPLQQFCHLAFAQQAVAAVYLHAALNSSGGMQGCHLHVLLKYSHLWCKGTPCKMVYGVWCNGVMVQMVQQSIATCKSPGIVS